MRIPFSVLFLLLVLAEIALFIEIGGAIGVPATLGLTLLGRIVGAMLLRFQGMATLARVRADMEAGRMPARPLADGAMSAAAALLIIVPGFLTDAIGILFFVPPVRAALWRYLGRQIRAVERPGARQDRRSPIVDLDPSQYGAPPRSDSPWRQAAPDARLNGPET